MIPTLIVTAAVFAVGKLCHWFGRCSGERDGWMSGHADARAQAEWAAMCHPRSDWTDGYEAGMSDAARIARAKAAVFQRVDAGPGRN